MLNVAYFFDNAIKGPANLENTDVLNVQMSIFFFSESLSSFSNSIIFLISEYFSFTFSFL